MKCGEHVACGELVVSLLPAVSMLHLCTVGKGCCVKNVGNLKCKKYADGTNLREQIRVRNGHGTQVNIITALLLA